MGERIFYELQKLDGNSKRISRFIDRVNTRWLRMESRVAEGAFLYARAGRVDRIFCGHTHVATHRARHGIDYYNSGSWIDANPTYLTIGEEGVEIREYEGTEVRLRGDGADRKPNWLPAGECSIRRGSLAGLWELRERALLESAGAGI